MNDDEMFEDDGTEMFRSSQGFRESRGPRSSRPRKGLSGEHVAKLEKVRAGRAKFFEFTKALVRENVTPWILRVAKTSERISRKDRLSFLLVFVDPPEVRCSEVDNSDEKARTVYVQVVSEELSTYRLVMQHFQPPTHLPAYRVVCNEQTTPDELIDYLSQVYEAWLLVRHIPVKPPP